MFSPDTLNNTVPTYIGVCSHSLHNEVGITCNLEMIQSVWRMCGGCMQIYAILFNTQGSWNQCYVDTKGREVVESSLMYFCLNTYFPRDFMEKC